MKNTTLEHVTPYFTDCLYVQVQSVDGIDVLPITAIQRKDGTDIIQVSNTDYYPDSDDNEFSIKPILRKMDLTKPIHVDDKEVIPIVELAKIMWGDNIEIGNFRKSENYQVCEINPNTMHVLRHLIFDDDGFHHSAPRHREPVLNQIRTCPNQRELWKWLYANKFDLEGLIEKGLAINVNDLKENPYE